MVIQCKNLISLYILPDQRRGNLLVFTMLRVKGFVFAGPDRPSWGFQKDETRPGMVSSNFGYGDIIYNTYCNQLHKICNL